MTAPAPTIVERLRTGDHVFHRPSEETWVVAWADYETGYMAPCGWPTCQARIDECDLVKKATDEESAHLVAAMSISRRTDANKAAEIADRAASSLSPQAAPAGAVEAAQFLLGRLRFFSDAPSDTVSDQRWHFDVLPAMRSLEAAIAAPSSGQRVDAPLAATQGVTAPSVDALFANCDKWGAVEWFNRLAMAIRNRDKSVVEGNDLSFATYDNIAKSSAARLVHDFENEIRAALTAAIGAGGQAVEAPAVKAQPVAEAGRELVEKFWGVRLEPLPETNAANAEEASECMWTDKPCTCGGGPCEQVDFGNDAGAGGQAVDAPHPDDLAVDRFAAAMKTKLANVNRQLFWAVLGFRLQGFAAGAVCAALLTWCLL